MKIAYIAAGAGGMYCGSCIHDNTLAAAMIKQGHDVALIPTYTPMRTDEDSVSLDRVFFGGLNVFLKQKYKIFRRTPKAVERMFNSPTLLKWISNLSSTTDARDLGALAVSVLQGEEGNQKRELTELIQWLKDSYKPDIVQLTNSMFLGFARQIKEELGVPVVCAVQGEDLFLDDMIEPYKTQARAILAERANDVDGFIATSKYYADYMADYLEVGKDKMNVVRLGIKLEGHGNGVLHEEKEMFTIGYLARICPEKGLHILGDAFYHLREELGTKAVRLKIAGYLGKKDQPYFDAFETQMKKRGLAEHYEYVGEVDLPEKISFLKSIDVLSVPTVYKEPKGLFVLEALANGVPVVQPGHGSFPEIVELTGGGILVEPESPEDLARGLRDLLTDSERRSELAENGKTAVHREFNDEKMAQATLEVYRKYLN